MTMTIELWGVRGSLPAPGQATTHTGGNTSGVEVKCGATRIVLDAGTGIRELGERLLRDGVQRVNVLLSHTHWGHIQGLPRVAAAWSSAGAGRPIEGPLARPSGGL